MRKLVLSFVVGAFVLSAASTLPQKAKKPTLKVTADCCSNPICWPPTKQCD